MKTSPLARLSKSARGFSLTELLVVIVIVAVLVGILMSVFGKVGDSARKVQVVNDARNVKVALINYYTDYRKYPINEIQQSALEYEGDDTVYGDPGGQYWSADLFNILRAQADSHLNDNNKYNPNGTVYWPGAFVKNPSKPVSGITTADYTVSGNTIHKGALVDPWGNEYLVWFDLNKDGDLSIAANWFYHDIDPQGKKIHVSDPPQGFAVGSLGPDGKFGKDGNNILAGSDDIVSWQ